MPKDAEKVTVDCPFCPGTVHQYRLRVDRTLIMRLTETGTEEPRLRTFARLFTCPATGGKFQARFQLQESPSALIDKVNVEATDEDQLSAASKVIGTEALSPHHAAVYEAGKKMLVDSVETGREFCKSMLTTSVTAIPVYLAILKLVLPNQYRLVLFDGILFVVPAVAFLIAAVLFVAGYLPRTSEFSLDLPSEIEQARSVSIRQRRAFGNWGFVLFAAAVILAIAGTLWALHAPPAGTNQSALGNGRS